MSGDGDDILRRHFVAIATSRYDGDPDWPDLSGVHDEVETLRNWLCNPALGSRRFVPAFPELLDSPSKTQVRTVLEESVQAWNESDAAVVFITGHGHVRDDTHWLVLRGAPGRADIEIRSADVLRWLGRTSIQHVLVIFDLCNAAASAYDSVRLDTPFPPNWIVLASTGIHEKARTGVLTAAIRRFLTDLDSPEGERFDHGPYLRVGDFLTEVQFNLRESGQTLSYVRPEMPVLKEMTPCLPSPRWREPATTAVQRVRRDLAIRTEDVLAHWDPKSRGVAETTETGWFFSGRELLMRTLVAFVTGKPGTLLVAGSAGCGKSSALARLVTLTDADFVQRYSAQIELIKPGLRPPIGAVDVAARATGKLPQEVFQQICAAFGVSVTARDLGGQSLDRLRQAWWRFLDDRAEPVTIVVDALDEAAYPNSLLVDVLSRLERPDGDRGRVRLIVGVRSPGVGDTAQETNRVALADRAEDMLRAQRLQVDREPLWASADLDDYAAEILYRQPGSPYRDDLIAAAEVGRIVGARAGTSYLVAQLAAKSLTHRDRRVDVSDPGWLSALDSGVVGVFRDDLHATLPVPADRERLVHLLRAVAFGYGRGLPWLRVWPLVANALRGDSSRQYGDADIAWLLNSRLGGYLTTDQEDDTTVYRLFHDTLRTTLRERWRELLSQEPA